MTTWMKAWEQARKWDSRHDLFWTLLVLNRVHYHRFINKVIFKWCYGIIHTFTPATCSDWFDHALTFCCILPGTKSNTRNVFFCVCEASISAWLVAVGPSQTLWPVVCCWLCQHSHFLEFTEQVNGEQHGHPQHTHTQVQNSTKWRHWLCSSVSEERLDILRNRLFDFFSAQRRGRPAKNWCQSRLIFQ